MKKVLYHIEHAEQEWILDRIGSEFKQHSRHNLTFRSCYDGIFIDDFDIIWLGASYDWQRLGCSPQTKDKLELVRKLASNPVICTIHHVTPWKWSESKHYEFMLRDKFVDMYHVYTEQVAGFVRWLSKKPVKIIPHWVDSKTWYPLNKDKCREELGIKKENFIIGSFQRDTEGSDLTSPKLEKGPDIFVEICKYFYNDKWNAQILLGGQRRQYVINSLNRLNIPYLYFENADLETVNKMYSACDLYVVGSRIEGGPQAVFEAAATRTNIISTDVGQSELLLDKGCIYPISLIEHSMRYKTPMHYLVPDNSCIEKNYNNIMKYEINNHIKSYDNLIDEVLERYNPSHNDAGMLLWEALVAN